jgi:Fe-S cluster assembly iron-binding protein IscA
MTSAEMLEGCRERWEWPSGRLGRMQARLSRHREFSADCHNEAVPADLIAPYTILLDTGRIVWGAVVEGDDLVTAPGAEDRSARVVYGLTPFFDRRPDALQRIGDALSVLPSETTEEEPDEERFALAALMRSGDDPLQKLLPMSLTGGHTSVCLSTLIVWRDRLPARQLTHPVLPLVVCPEKTPHCMLLPLRYWSPDLVRLWHEEAAGKVAGVRVTASASGFTVDDPAAHQQTLALPPPSAPPADARSRYLAAPLRVTPEASQHFLRWLKKERLSPREALLLALVRTGPDGKPDYRASIARSNRVEAGDVVTDAGYEGVRVLVPAPSLEHLVGKVIDFRPDRNGGTLVFRNPGETI